MDFNSLWIFARSLHLTSILWGMPTSFLQGFLILLLSLMFIRRTRYGQYGHCIPIYPIKKVYLLKELEINFIHIWKNWLGPEKRPYLVILSTLTALENTLLQINASVSVATFFAKLATWSFEAHLQPFP